MLNPTDSKKVDLSMEFCGLRFENPFLLSSGPPTANVNKIERAFEAGWAGVVTKVLGSKPRPDPHPRIASLHYGGKVIAIENIESVIYPLKEWLPKITEIKKKYPEKILIPNLMGGAEPECWQRMIKDLQEAGADMIELNLSCPLTDEVWTVGATLGQDPNLTREATSLAKEVATVPIMVKLTPNVTDITLTAKAAEDGGADAISAINTIKGLIGIDLERMEPLPSVKGISALGGISGPAIKPISLRCVAQIAKATKLPISGIGGISKWEDAVEFFMVGASTVQLCTAVMIGGYRIISNLKDGVSTYLYSKGFGSVKELVGYVLPKIKSQENLDYSYWTTPVLNASRCTKCGLCQIACMDGGSAAITIEDGLPKINQEKCDACGLCAQVCPKRALILKPWD
ncbi:MAG: NAD-dependent dihydropyrimidine dehydrogenase subunit PreA [Candidatus Hadarchaeum sp.]|uniref:NAD-dependent dihydropyrimidine dehydrogenase subunit PreA n=1 Tax=Candidatus Hadarchaeum sp. TaxID=2883567 RepID=UPI003D0DB88C